MNYRKLGKTGWEVSEIGHSISKFEDTQQMARAASGAPSFSNEEHRLTTLHTRDFAAA